MQFTPAQLSDPSTRTRCLQLDLVCLGQLAGYGNFVDGLGSPQEFLDYQDGRVADWAPNMRSVFPEFFLSDPLEAGNGGSSELPKEASSSAFIGLPSAVEDMGALGAQLRERVRRRRRLIDEARRVSEKIRQLAPKGVDANKEVSRLASLVLAVCALSRAFERYLYLKPSGISSAEVGLFTALLALYDDRFPTYSGLIAEVYPEAVVSPKVADYGAEIVKAEAALAERRPKPLHALAHLVSAVRVTLFHDLAEVEGEQVRERRERVLTRLVDDHWKSTRWWKRTLALTWVPEPIIVLGAFSSGERLI